jgi:hypothetical protein
MKSALIIHLRRLLLFSAVVSLAAVAAFFILPGTFFSPAIPFLILFFIATSLLSFHYIIRTADKRFIKFVNAYLLTVVIKLLLYAVILIAYAFLYRSDAVPFMLGFFLLYLSYTVFESVSIIRYSAPTGKEGNEDAPAI